METRKIADLEVSTLCFGTMMFGTPVGEKDAVRMVHEALDEGINFFDTADMYEGYSRSLGSHGGVAEKFLGKALKDRRQAAIVTTKAGNPVDGPESTSDIGQKHLAKQLDRSLKYLQFDCVDIFELHRPVDGVPLEESVAAMDGFVKAGKIRCWGFSNFDALQIRELVQICDSNGYARPVVSQQNYSWLHRESETAHIPTCREFGIAVTPFRVLAGGLLTGKYKRGKAPPAGSRAAESTWLEAPDEILSAELDQFEGEAKSAGMKPTQYALQWVLGQPSIASCVVGLKNLKQLRDLAEAATKGS